MQFPTPPIAISGDTVTVPAGGIRTSAKARGASPGPRLPRILTGRVASKATWRAQHIIDRLMTRENHMEWVEEFYSRTGRWWGPAEAMIRPRDLARVATVERLAPHGKTVLDLGAGYGNTAAAMADAGFDVTAVEISDRAGFSERFMSGQRQGALRVVRDDFYAVQLEGAFHVVTYWNGFGVGTDADQRQLLRRIANDWLDPEGVALIDVANPLVWARWHGDRESKEARPEAGYHFSVEELTEFDPVNCRGVDTWWEVDDKESAVTQSIRCYSPADLALLVEGTGLAIDSLEVAGVTLLRGPHSVGVEALLERDHEYLAILKRR